jgi:hypothetical protein
MGRRRAALTGRARCRNMAAAAGGSGDCQGAGSCAAAAAAAAAAGAGAAVPVSSCVINGPGPGEASGAWGMAKMSPGAGANMLLSCCSPMPSATAETAAPLPSTPAGLRCLAASRRVGLGSSSNKGCGCRRVRSRRFMTGCWLPPSAELVLAACTWRGTGAGAGAGLGASCFRPIFCCLRCCCCASVVRLAWCCWGLLACMQAVPPPAPTAPAPGSCCCCCCCCCWGGALPAGNSPLRPPTLVIPGGSPCRMGPCTTVTSAGPGRTCWGGCCCFLA